MISDKRKETSIYSNIAEERLTSKSTLEGITLGGGSTIDTPAQHRGSTS
jgi:hypothetical protein